MKIFKNLVVPILVITSFAFSSDGLAQQPNGQTAPPVAWLAEDDIDRFVTTMPQIRAEFEQLGLDHESDPNLWMTHAKAQEILAKYGWDQLSFAPKWAAIVAGYAFTKMSAQLELMPAEEKAQAEQYMGTMLTQYKNSVHENDIALIKSKMATLDAMFENE